MKKFLLLFGLLLLAAVTFAQAPQAFKYQSVARNAIGEPLENQEISVLISILAGNPSGTVVYSERHLTTTNGLGLFNLEIGNPDEVLSGVFSEINWGTGSYFLKLELDETGGSNYQLMGFSQLLSVPYSLFAKTAGNGFSGDYNDLTNQPALWDSTWLTIKNKPTTVSGYGITDAMTTLHPANGISYEDITSWNTAFGWGNHAVAGYLTSFTENDPIFGSHPSSGITTTLITNWNTAYSNRITAASGTAPLTLTKSGTSITGSMTAANSTTNGYLTSANWNTFNNKQNALVFGNLTSSDITVTGGTGAIIGSGTSLLVNKGNLTEETSSVLTITGGNNSVLGAGTSIQVKQANAGQSGFLSGTDWNIFNNKISSQWVTGGSNISYNSGKVGIGTSTLAPSAAFEVSSTNSGVLLPRMTFDQRNAIASPAEGLMVFCTDCCANGVLSIFSNGEWRTFTQCNVPVSSPAANNLSPGQIIWNWTAVSGASGYKWNSTNNYGTATDMLTASSKAETGIACDTNYTRYVWVYNECGISNPVSLSQTVSTVAPVSPYTDLHVSTQTSIVWNWNTVPDATGFKWNTTEDFETATDVGTATTKSETGLTCATEYIRYVWAYNGCGYSTPATLTQSTLPCWICGDPFTITHTTGNVAPVDKTVSYGTVTNIPGEPSKCWITRNLGATQQATAVNDNTEASAGWYWQFNRKQGFKHDGTTRTPNTTWISSISENSDWIPTNDPCAIELGSGWRIPTNAEWTNFFASINFAGNYNVFYNSGLKLHTAGYLSNSNGSLQYRYSIGYYTSSTQNNSTQNYLLIFASNNAYIAGNSIKSTGYALRCLRDASSNLTVPVISSTSVSNITQTTAISGGEVTSDGGATVNQRGVCWSTISNPTVADSHTSDGSGNGVFTSNLTGLSPNTLYYIRAYATNSLGTGYGNELSFTTLPWSCGNPITINHIAIGGVAPIDKSVTYGTVANIPGETSKCWITSNLGADSEAISFDDATEASAGWYWQFNRKQGFKHDGTTRTPNTIWISSISENSDWTPANDPCTTELGLGWRIPTSIELSNIDGSGNWTDWNGPWNSGLKMHAAGDLNNIDGSLNLRGSSGYYWSSSTNSNTNGLCLGFNISSSNIISITKALGFSLRCIKE